MTSGVCVCILLFATGKEVQQLSGSVNHSLSTCSYSSIALLVHMGCFHVRFPSL